MEKRVILALVLSLAFLFLYQQFVVKWIAPPPIKKTAANKDAGERPFGQVKVTEKDVKAAGDVSQARQGESVPAHPEETATVETPLYKAVFSSRGGGIKSWELKNYKESLEQTAANVEMITPALEEYPLEDRLVKGNSAEAIYFKPSGKSISLSQGQNEELSFIWQSSDGIRIEKKYNISANTYAIQAETTVSNNSANPFQGRLTTGLISSVPFIKKRGGSYHIGPILYSSGKVLKKDIKEGEEKLTGKIDWLGLEEMYFVSAVIPKKMENAEWSAAATNDTVKTSVTIPVNLAPASASHIVYSAYLGPKEMDILTAQGVHLEDSIDLGWFSFMAKPFLMAMNFLHAYIPNYGLVIILLTVIIKILFHPLTKKSLNSMKEMQKVQPQIAALRERYKDDKEKMNRELMELYKRYKINPVGGCLPMILQIPVFIALYNVLSASIELRHAPFALWIYDLSAKDPYYVTPILMGATMLVQQKMTPSTVDPMQAKVMLIMPVVFTFMFLSFPSGLVIYWLINNVLSIAQQYYIQKTAK